MTVGRSVNNNFLFALEMFNFVPTKQHSREVLLNFILRKGAAESYYLLVEVYGVCSSTKSHVKRLKAMRMI